MDDANSETGLEARRTASNAARRHGSRQSGINGDDAGSLRPRRRTRVEAEEEEEKDDDDFQAATTLHERLRGRRGGVDRRPDFLIAGKTGGVAAWNRQKAESSGGGSSTHSLLRSRNHQGIESDQGGSGR